MSNGKVIVVTGASRGLGRGIARQFGRLGATVYLTSRASSADSLRDAAAEVDAVGGVGIAVPVDHREPAETEALAARVLAEQGYLDILINNAAAVHETLGRPGPFLEKPLALLDMIEVGLRSSYVMAYYAAPLMIARRAGLIANISFYGASTYFHGPAYGAAKAGTDKMTFDMAIDLRPRDVACVSLWPGFIYTDALARFVESTPESMIPERLKVHLPNFERPEFSGLVVNALHDDPARMSLSGEALIGAELGIRYGIADLSGRQGSCEERERSFSFQRAVAHWLELHCLARWPAHQPERLEYNERNAPAALNDAGAAGRRRAYCVGRHRTRFCVGIQKFYVSRRRSIRIARGGGLGHLLRFKK